MSETETQIEAQSPKKIRKRLDALKDMFGDRDFDQDLKRLAEQTSTKPRTSEVSYCTYATWNDKSSFVTMSKLWVMSILKTEPVIPDIHIVYDGARLSCFDCLKDVVTLVPQIWHIPKDARYISGHKITPQAESNFCGKFQALLSCNSPYCCWIDCDLVLKLPIVPFIQGNIFTPSPSKENKRVIGNFYCLAEEWKPKFYSGMFEALSMEHQWQSDRDLMKNVIQALDMPFRKLENGGDAYWLHMTRKQVKSPTFREKFKEYVLNNILA